MVKIVAVSDTHNRLEFMELPPGDILVHGGDWTGRGKPIEIQSFASALKQHSDKYKHIVLVAGNHDFQAERDPEEVRKYFREASDKIHWLENQSVELMGLKFWGSAWQPWFHAWAFNKHEEELRTHWATIPEDTDVLLTHSPPRKILDTCANGYHAGCRHLRDNILERVKPKLHVFGHIHEAHGVMEVDDTTFINASLLNEKYVISNAPVIFNVEQ